MELEKRTTRTLPRSTRSTKATNGEVTTKRQRTVVAPEQRYKMICEAAYYIAEKRGFQNGLPAEDWVKAEKQVDAILSRIDTMMNR